MKAHFPAIKSSSLLPIYNRESFTWPAEANCVYIKIYLHYICVVVHARKPPTFSHKLRNGRPLSKISCKSNWCQIREFIGAFEQQVENISCSTFELNALSYSRVLLDNFFFVCMRYLCGALKLTIFIVHKKALKRILSRIKKL